MISFKLIPWWEVKYSGLYGHFRLALHADLEATGQLGFEVKVPLHGEIGCEKKLAEYPIPIAGPLTWFFGPKADVYLVSQLAGDLSLMGAKVEAKLTITGSGVGGIDCPPGITCNGIGTLDVHGKPEFDWDANVSARFEPELFAGIKVKGAFGVSKLSKILPKSLGPLQLNIIEGKFGVKAAGSFASVENQINDNQYKSDYSLLLAGTIQPGEDLKEFGKFWGFPDILGLKFDLSLEMGHSPKGTVTANQSTFNAGDIASFNVKLDPESVTVLHTPIAFPYNISEVQLWRRVLSAAPIKVSTLGAVSGQTDFHFSYAMPATGKAEEFFAVVDAVVPPLFDFEIGQAEPLGPVLTITFSGTGVGGVGSFDIVGGAPSPNNKIMCATPPVYGQLVPGPQCQSAFALNETVQLGAMAVWGSKFGGWSNDCNGVLDQTSVVMDQDRLCVVHFIPEPRTIVLMALGIFGLGIMRRWR